MSVPATAGAAELSRAQSLFGTESEYAVSGWRGGQVLPPSDVALMLLARAESYPHMRGVEAGMFLPSGGRFYIDQSHPEWASPECTNPWEAVRHGLAGDLFLSRLAADLERADPSIDSLAVRKGNIDYQSRVTWGNHENYLLRRNPRGVRPGLVSHLVTRIVMAGAGGFDPFDTRGPRFVLSPRALFLRRGIGMSLPSALTLVDERAQHHCAGFYRQHLMCGEGVQSHLAALLRLGTTALVVALVDGQLADLAELDLADPMEALSTVARDQTLKRPLLLRAGGQGTAVDIQRRLLREVRSHRSRLPEWSDALCDQWEDILSRLARGPVGVADRLDWAIKLAMYRDRAQTKGIAWPEHEDAASDALLPTGAAEQWRAELCELDVLFGQVYPSSVFESLDRAGVLAHRVRGIDTIDAALTTPPADGRARLRGEAVSRLAGRAGYTCTWDGVHDLRSRSRLDLADPFATTAAWTRVPPAPSSVSGLPANEDALRQLAERLCAPDAYEDRRAYASYAIELNNRGIALRGAGRLEGAVTVLRAALVVDVQVRPPGHPKLPHRRNNLAGALLMLGRLEEAVRVVTTAWAEKGDQYDRTSARVLTTRLVLAMRLGEPTALFVGQLKTHLAIQPLPDFADVEPRWTVAPALAVLAHHLGEADMQLLKAITGFLNGEPVDALRALPAWTRAFPRRLDEAWPPTRPEA